MRYLRVFDSLLTWRHAPGLLRTCFVLSIIFTLFRFASVLGVLRALQLSYPIGWQIARTVDAVSIIGSVTLWFGMTEHLRLNHDIGWVKKAGWWISLFIGIVWVADLYYLLSYQRSPYVDARRGSGIERT